MGRVQQRDVYFSAKPYAAPFNSVGLDIADNLIYEISTSNTAKVQYYTYCIQGLHRLIPAVVSMPCRGLVTTSGNRTFGVWGNEFREVVSQGDSYVVRGTLLTYTGVVRFAENGYQVIAVDGQNGYIHDLTSNVFAQILDEYFPGVDDPGHGPTHVVCLDTYFIVNKSGTNKYFWSAPGYVPYAFDATQPSILNLWWGLNFGEKIGDSDNIVALAATPEILWVFGQNSMEPHHNAANENPTTQIFQRLDNAVVAIGCGAPDTVVNFGNNVYWLSKSRQGIVGLFTCGTDFQPSRISQPGLDTRIQSYGDLSGAFAFAYAVDHHSFINWVFPTGTSTDGGTEVGATWAYDVTVGTCNRRTKWVAAEGKAYPHQAQFATQNWNMLIVGDNSSDALYWLDQSRYYNDQPTGDVPQDIQIKFTSPIGYDNNHNIIYWKVQLNHQPGFAPRSGYGSHPKIGLRISNDTGVTWGRSVFASMGRLGQYSFRTEWSPCGIGRNRVFEWTCTAPVKRVFTGYTIFFEECSR